MRYVTSASLGLFTFTMAAVPAYAQDVSKAALPDPTTCPESLSAIATCYTARHPSGAYLLAALPKNWNGSLVVFAHGGPAVVPPTVRSSTVELSQAFRWFTISVPTCARSINIIARTCRVRRSRNIRCGVAFRQSPR